MHEATRKYTSKYGIFQQVTPEEYIAECLCENRASSKNKELPFSFMNLPEWRAFYYVQLNKVHELSEKYHHRPILDVIIDRKIYMLGAKWIEDVIIEQQVKYLADLERIKLDKAKKQNDLYSSDVYNKDIHTEKIDSVKSKKEKLSVSSAGHKQVKKGLSEIYDG